MTLIDVVFSNLLTPQTAWYCLVSQITWTHRLWLVYL